MTLPGVILTESPLRGPLDYLIVMDKEVLLVHRATKEDFEKGAPQNILQMHIVKRAGGCYGRIPN